MSSIETRNNEEGIKKILIDMLRFIDMKVVEHPKTVAVCLSWEEIEDNKAEAKRQRQRDAERMGRAPSKKP